MSTANLLTIAATFLFGLVYHSADLFRSVRSWNHLRRYLPAWVYSGLQSAFAALAAAILLSVTAWPGAMVMAVSLSGVGSLRSLTGKFGDDTFVDIGKGIESWRDEIVTAVNAQVAQEVVDSNMLLAESLQSSCTLEQLTKRAEEVALALDLPGDDRLARIQGDGFSLAYWLADISPAQARSLLRSSGQWERTAGTLEAGPRRNS